jgi:dihydropteroate synthase
MALQTRIENLIADGADVIDLGAVSTAPDAPVISEQEEIARFTRSVFFFDKKNFLIQYFSLDTTRASIARIGIEHGITMINDVS